MIALELKVQFLNSRRPVLASDQARAQAAAAAAAPGGAARGAAPGPDDVVRGAQINLARNLGREAFAVVFPGIPFPPEAGGPAPAGVQAGLAPPPRDGVPGAPRAALPNGVGGAAVAAGAPTRANGGPGHDNPLARFSLPDHRLPPSGEAGLYGPNPGTPGVPTSWSGVAYGGYPASSSTRTGQPLTAAQGSRIPNLEERLAHIRERMAQAAATLTPLNGATPAPTPTTTPTATPVVAQPTPTPTTPVASSSSAPSTAVPPPTPTVSAESELASSPRQAALEAAERRAGLAKKPTPSPNGAPAPVVKPVLAPEAVATATVRSLAELSESPAFATSTPPPLSTPAFAFLASVTEQHLPTFPTTSPIPPTTANAYPRLIPLFSPNSPLASASYPHLLAAMPPAVAPPFFGPPRPPAARPLVPASPTEEQLRELSHLTRTGIEERLRVLVGFQDRMASLAADMGQVLSVLPADPTPAAGERSTELAPSEPEVAEERKLDKGKRPVEGVHAEAPPVVGGD